MTWLSGLHLACFSLPAPDIWPTLFKGHFRHSTDENEPIDHMLMESQLPILGTGNFFLFFWWNLRYFPLCSSSSPPPPFLEWLSLHVVFKAKLEEKERGGGRFGCTITVQCYPGALITWNRNWHILAFCAIFHSKQFLGTCFSTNIPVYDGISGVGWST